MKLNTFTDRQNKYGKSNIVFKSGENFDNNCVWTVFAIRSLTYFSIPKSLIAFVSKHYWTND